MGENDEGANFKVLLDEIRKVRDIVQRTEGEVAGLRGRIEQLEIRDEKVQEEIKILHSAGANVEDKIEELEKYSRKNNIIISGVPLDKDDNPREIVKMIAEELKVTLQEYDISEAHRLPTKRGVPDIIAKLRYNEIKAEMIKQAKLNRLSLRGVPIYISEHLLLNTKLLLKEAKQLKRENRVKSVWTRNGDLYVRKADGMMAKKVRCIEDMREFREQIKAPPAVQTPSDRPLGGATKRNIDERSPGEQRPNTNANTSANKKFHFVTNQLGTRSRKNSATGAQQLQTTLDSFKTTRGTTDTTTGKLPGDDNLIQMSE